MSDAKSCGESFIKRVAVLGSGSWGTALSISLASCNHKVMMWSRRPEAAKMMQTDRHNYKYLSKAVFPDSLTVTSDLDEAIKDADLWLFAVPAQSVRQVAELVKTKVKPGLIVVSAAKGIELGTLKTTSQVLDEVLTDVPLEQIGVLYGPSHAEEVGLGMATAVLASAGSENAVKIIQETFMAQALRVYTNMDLLGVEISGAVKNVMALAGGISDGLGFGDNAKAAIVTRGMAEIRRLGIAMGAKAETFSGLAGIGDLVVTCMSKHSRNRFYGEQLGKGKTREEIENEMHMVAEGVKTTKSVKALAGKYNVEMPITEAVYAVVFDGKSPLEGGIQLMTREARFEGIDHD